MVSPLSDGKYMEYKNQILCAILPLGLGKSFSKNKVGDFYVGVLADPKVKHKF